MCMLHNTLAEGLGAVYFLVREFLKEIWKNFGNIWSILLEL